MSRLVASIIDSVLVIMLTLPILFWIYKSATPDKMEMSAKIVDGNIGHKPTIMQYII